MSANRNAALAAATGEFFVFRDADGRLAPDYVERAVAVLRGRPEVGIVAPDTLWFGDANGASPTTFEVGSFLLGNTLPICCATRTADLRTVGGFCEDLPHHEDWDLWLGLLGLGREVALLGAPLFHRRVRTGQLSETMTTRTNPPVFAAILRRHQALSVEHGEAFWQALLEQRAMLGHFKARYGRLEDAVHALRRRNRRP